MKKRTLWLAAALAVLVVLAQGMPQTAHAAALIVEDIKTGTTIDTGEVTAITGFSECAYCAECMEIYFTDNGGLKKAALQAGDHADHADKVGGCASWVTFRTDHPGVYTVVENELYHVHAEHLTEVPGTPATCTTSGTKSYWKCTCGKNFADAAAKTEIGRVPLWQKEGADGYLAPLGHSLRNYHISIAATCTHAGNVEYYLCANCDAKLDAQKNVIEDIVIPQLDHTFTKKDTADKYLKTPADCTHAAEYYYSCSVCGEKGTETFTEGSPLGHELVFTYAPDFKTLTLTCAHEDCAVSSALTVTGGTFVYTGEPVYGSVDMDDDFMPLLGLDELALSYLDENDEITGSAPVEPGAYLVGAVIKYNGGEYAPCDNLVILPAITVTAQPESQTVTGEKRVYFTVEAEGEGLTYQWQQQKPGKTAWANCVSATGKTDTLAINAREAVNGYTYRCVIDNGFYSVTSETATLTVEDIPVTTQPESQTVTGEKRVYFHAAAEGEGLTYQWQQRKPGQTAWCRCVSATGKTDTLAINAREAVNGYAYRCVITGSNGSVISEIATLTVEDIPVTTQPKSVTTATEKKVYFHVSATGEGLTYQWQQQKPGQTAWCRCVSATATTAKLAINAREAVNGYSYRCVITGSNGSVISETATLTYR